MSNTTEPTADIPPPPGGLGPSDDDEITDQDELKPPLPSLETSTMDPMPDVPPGPEAALPPLASTEEPLDLPTTRLEDELPPEG